MAAMFESVVGLWRFILLALVSSAALAQAGERQEALRQLTEADEAGRRHAVMQLAELGGMEDVKALLGALRDDDALVRHIAEQAIWAIWSRSGEARVDELLVRGTARLQRGDLAGAIELFSDVIHLRPDFAEGWNKRATAWFLAGEYGKSLKDCDEVLRRNPTHFGVLSGYGQIYYRLDRLEQSIEYFRRALEVNPNLEGARRSIEAIESELVERRKRFI